MSNEIEDLGLTDVDEDESSVDKRKRIIREGKRKLNETPHTNDKDETTDSAEHRLVWYEDQEEYDRRSLQTTSMVIQAASLVLAFGGTFAGVFASCDSTTHL